MSATSPSVPSGPIPAQPPRRWSSHPVADVAQLVAIVVLAIFILVPIYWMVSTSIKTANQTFAMPPVFVFQPTFDHYREVFAEGAVTKGLRNSLIVASLSTLLALLLGTPAAYAMARFDFRGKASLWFWIISNRFISPIVVALPFFLLARDLSLLDSHWVLILTYLTFNIPLVIWLCIDQFRAIPRDIDQAAMVDGANQWQALRKLVMPLAIPGLVVAAIHCFVFSWNEFLFALVLTRAEAKTAPVEAANFMTGFGVRWGAMMATGTLIVLPVVVFAAIVSRHLVRGLTMGAVK